MDSTQEISMSNAIVASLRASPTGAEMPHAAKIDDLSPRPPTLYFLLA